MPTNDIRIDKVLTTVARGYSNAEFIGEVLYPTVSVDNETGRIPLFGKEAFMIWDKMERAMRAKSNEIEGGVVSTVGYATREYDAKRILDYREIKESELNQEIWAVNSCMDAISLDKEVRIANLAFATTNYATNNTTTMTDDFLNEDAIDPIEYLMDTAHAPLRAAIGKYPNIHVWGACVWEKLRNHPKIKAYMATGVEQVITLEFIAKLLEVDKIYVGKALKTTDKSTLVDVWGNGIVAAYVKPASGYTRTPLEPCFGYTLQLKGNPYSDKGDEEGGKLHWVRTTDNYEIKTVGNDSAFFLKNPIDPSKL